MTVTFLSDRQLFAADIRACGLLANPTTVPGIEVNGQTYTYWTYWDGRHSSQWSESFKRFVVARLLQAGAKNVRVSGLSGANSAKG